MKKTVFSLLFLCTFSLSAAIIETSHFKELPSYVTQETLVILDIDDTLLLPCQTLGNDAWFTYQLAKHKSEEMTSEQALDKTLAEWEAIRHITNMQLVEPETAQIVKELQDSNITVMGLTTQGLALATRTVSQLNNVEIDLTKTAPAKEDCYFINGHGVLFRKGILFTAGTAKGPALVTLLQKIGYKPQRIVFINDKETHLLDVSGSLEKEGVAFLGLRYNFSDERVKSFRKDIAEVQFAHSTFTHILSDAEAEALLPSAGQAEVETLLPNTETPSTEVEPTTAPEAHPVIEVAPSLDVIAAVESTPAIETAPSVETLVVPVEVAQSTEAVVPIEVAPSVESVQNTEVVTLPAATEGVASIEVVATPVAITEVVTDVQTAPVLTNEVVAAS
jgi:hypothetical protein